MKNCYFWILKNFIHFSALNTTVIYPATQKHLDKFSKKEVNLVEETPELYKSVTIPKVIGEQFSLQVYRKLSHITLYKLIDVTLSIQIFDSKVWITRKLFELFKIWKFQNKYKYLSKQNFNSICHRMIELFELLNKSRITRLWKLADYSTHKIYFQWVDNILSHKAEAERIIYEDPDEENGFIMLPDLRWDGNVNTLNVLAISRRKIKCIRELNESHLPLLRNIKVAGMVAIVKKYDVPASKIRVFFHYLPSYYHLHVHFTHLSVEDVGIYTEKAHLLSSVISNIELMPDYYQKATLTFAVFKPELVNEYQASESLEKSDEPELKKGKKNE